MFGVNMSVLRAETGVSSTTTTTISKFPTQEGTSVMAGGGHTEGKLFISSSMYRAQESMHYSDGLMYVHVSLSNFLCLQ